MLKNKVALITGCNRGIGRSMLEQFASHGAIIYANARQTGCLDETANELMKEHSTTVIPVYFDINDKQAIKDCFKQIQKEQKRLDILVNNAGILKEALLGMIDESAVQEIFATNVFATIGLSQYAIRLMSRQKSGCIINMASVVGVHGIAGQSVYAASKGAVIAFTKSLAKEVAKDNIRVNAIAPGMIDTDMYDRTNDKAKSDNLQKIALGRLGNPDEIANVAVFLASDAASYVSGQIIGVDGMTVI